jgi:alkaline phosphatase
MKKILFLLVAVAITTANVNAQEDYKDKNEKLSYENKDFHDVKTYDESRIKFKDEPENIILLIGDGMGVAQVMAGITANKGILNLLNMKNMGLSKTQSASSYITDSAAGGTALACGKKTKNHSLGVDADGKPVKSILEYAEENDKVTGLVSTSAITHATPASFVAHTPDRGEYEKIAMQLTNSGVDVFIGGGYDFFAHRSDSVDLTKKLEDKGYRIFRDLSDVPDNYKGKLGVLTAAKHNPKYNERGNMLPDATQKAIKTLDKISKDGFFLMVEGSQVDWGGHQNDMEYIVTEMLDFDKAIGIALKYAAKHKNTLVIVTADHETGGLANMGTDIKTGKVKGGFSTGGHTGGLVPVFAFGPGADQFRGIYENTEIFHKMFQLYNFKSDK